MLLSLLRELSCLIFLCSCCVFVVVGFLFYFFGGCRLCRLIEVVVVVVVLVLGVVHLNELMIYERADLSLYFPFFVSFGLFLFRFVWVSVLCGFGLGDLALAWVDSYPCLFSVYLTD